MDDVPSLGVGASDPVHQSRKICHSIALNDEMPVIGHKAVRNYLHIEARQAFSNDAQEREVVAVVVK
jgi:hypothetical protein